MVSQLHTRKAKNKDTRGTTGTWSHKCTYSDMEIYHHMCGGRGSKKKLTSGEGRGGGFSLKEKKVWCGGLSQEKEKSLIYKQGWGGYFCANFLLSPGDVHLFALLLVLQFSILNLIPSASCGCL